MPFCSNCGKEVRPGVKFCPNCGAPQDESTSGASSPAPSPQGGPSRPSLAGVFIILYLGLGIVQVFLGGYSLLFSTLFTTNVLVIALVIFLGTGVLSLLTVYGFLKGGRLASKYVVVTGIWCIVAGAFLSISGAIGLVAIGALEILLGFGTLVYIRFGNVKSYLSR